MSLQLPFHIVICVMKRLCILISASLFQFRYDCIIIRFEPKTIFICRPTQANTTFGRFVAGSHTLTWWYRQNNCRVPLDFAASVRTYPVMRNGEVLPGKRTSSNEVRFVCAIPSEDKTKQILVEYDVHWWSI